MLHATVTHDRYTQSLRTVVIRGRHMRASHAGVTRRCHTRSLHAALHTVVTRGRYTREGGSKGGKKAVVAAEAADAVLDGEIWRDTAGYCDNVARYGEIWRDMARYGRMGGVAVSTSRVQSDNTSRVADYPPMYSARRQSDATRHLASGRPTQDVEALCRIWWTPSAQRAPAPQEARKRCKALAARTMCSVGDHEPPRSEHLRGRTRPAETRQQESRVAASVSTDCSIQTTSDSPTINQVRHEARLDFRCWWSSRHPVRVLEAACSSATRGRSAGDVASGVAGSVTSRHGGANTCEYVLRYE